MKIGTIGARRRRDLGRSDAADAAVSHFVHGGGPIVPGPLFPFVVHHHRLRCDLRLSFAGLFRNHAQDDLKEGDVRTIGYGAMLLEGMVGIMALIAAPPWPPATTSRSTCRRAKVQREFGPIVDLPELRRSRREDQGGRRRRVAGCGNGSDIHRSGHEGTDFVLVSLRDHVRSAIHTHHDRCGNARGAVSGAGVFWPDS